MLPFLKNRNERQNAGIAEQYRSPDEKVEESPEDSSAAIEACAEALIKAVHAKDTRKVAEALNDCFIILESLPHAEAEHVSPHSYDAQKEED